MDTIDEDLPCAECGYNLRTLSADGVCPECGGKVAASLEAFSRGRDRYVPLRRYGESWMESTRDALYLGLAAWFLSFFSTLSISHQQSPGQISLFAIACGLWFWFGWRLLGPTRNVVTVVARVAVVSSVASVLASGINDHWASYYFGKFGPLPWPLGDRFFDATYAVSRIAPYASVLLVLMIVGRLLFVTWLGHRFVLLSATSLLTFATALGLAIELMQYAYRLPFRMIREPLQFALIAFVLSPPVWFGLLIWHLTRAIRLGGLPAANSRSSPSERPPG